MCYGSPRKRSIVRFDLSFPLARVFATDVSLLDDLATGGYFPAQAA
jgi:hypothetical protein